MINLIDKVNESLSSQFGVKHRPITQADIESVYARQVLSIQADAKTKKGLKKGYLTGILYLAPADLSGVNICPKASQGCRAACLFSAGRGRFYSVNRARIVKTLAYHLDRARFIDTLKKSIRSLIVKAENKGLTPAVRLNGTSDILWEQVSDIIQTFPTIIFYDYTKISARLFRPIPVNYTLTFSLSESNDRDAILALSRGVNVATVFSGPLPAQYMGRPVIDGDITDLRFLDPKDRQGLIVGLKAKGAAKEDRSGFVRQALGAESERRVA